MTNYMPIIKNTSMAHEAIFAAFQYQQKIFSLKKQNRLEEVAILEKARSNKMEDHQIFSGICNASIFEERN
jgi:hypothetical protein